MSRLYPCVYCTEDGYCKKYSDEEVTSWCVQSPCKDEKPSNADRIRAMTDEGLAHLLYTVEDSIFTGNLWSYKQYLDWLKQEATDVN